MRKRISESKKLRIERIVNARTKLIQNGSQINEWEWPDWGGIADIGQGILAGAGMIPLVGNLADLANAGWSTARGNYGDAAINLASAIPGAGLAIGGASLANKGNNLYKGLKGGKAVATAIKPVKATHKIVKGGNKIANDGTPVKSVRPATNYAGVNFSNPFGGM
jgi:hypothetical protein